MIYELFSNKKNFKPIKFQKGLNIVLADTHKNYQKDSRNGLGKTTLISLIHFCLGSANFKNDLPVEKLENWEFSIKLDLFDEKITATRSFNKPNYIKIKGKCENFPIKAKNNLFTVEEWKNLLEKYFFSLNNTDIKFEPPRRVDGRGFANQKKYYEYYFG